MKHFDFQSTASVYKHVRMLERKGYLCTENHGYRSIIPPQKVYKEIVNDIIEITLMGVIREGMPIESFSQIQKIPVHKNQVRNPENSYGLRVLGNGFHSELIKDGDMLIVEARSEVESGETIIALANQHESLIRIYSLEGAYITLSSYDHSLPPDSWNSEQIQILAVLTGILRGY